MHNKASRDGINNGWMMNKSGLNGKESNNIGKGT